MTSTALAKAPKPKIYGGCNTQIAPEPAGPFCGYRWYLYKSTGTWEVNYAGIHGTYTTSGKDITLTEYVPSGPYSPGPCIYSGVKGKKTVAYSGTYECGFGVDKGVFELLKE